MEWAMWLFTVDIWLCYRLARGEGVLVPVLLAMGSAVVNTAISIIAFALLSYLVKQALRRFDGYQLFGSVINRQLRSSLARKEEAGQRVIGYLEKWRQYKGFIIVAINLVPFVPWITGGTILYAVLVRDLKALGFVLLGLAMKSVMIAGVVTLIRLLWAGGR